MVEWVMTALEVAFVVLAAAGVALIVAALVGGVLGAGLGLVAAGCVALGCAEFARSANAHATGDETP